ncbi:M23 family metallopeptidase [Plantactinospora soyae]|uniref:Murein DD-endopeptidase MepM/ murein hydrolase activator NlpD n=1 Tax=Plantactinospora soyae TaxID=1544732 RepID=A0A927QXH9_9ACTN|nr:M23 family metallopeptidase [Plantactinospora soyae]MBE1486737.1 murein DD-endopeptidase MepM/ murein hydrolase activator NlpD [Plantactinospora soyae]
MLKTLMILHRCCWVAFLAILVTGFFLDFSSLWGWLAIAVAIATRFVMGRLLRPSAEETANPPAPVEVRPPVTGRWSALNSPATKVPSHGLRAYGQAYAIDVLAEPEGGTRPAFGWWPLARRNRDFPAFGAPLLAVADGTVVRAVDRNRDHLSRNSYPALLYLAFEALFREIAGPGQILGNHLILDLGNGTYAGYAHLRRGSLLVGKGDRVRAGQPVARCGNSGNSTEPHVHFQLMDNPDLDVARGIPFTWRGLGVPANGEVFSVDPVHTEEPERAGVTR